jgi:hypothetical protein
MNFLPNAGTCPGEQPRFESGFATLNVKYSGSHLDEYKVLGFGNGEWGMGKKIRCILEGV